MKRNIKDIFKVLLAIMCFAAISVSCNNDDSGTGVDDRLFMPIFFNDSVYVEGNTLHVGWYGLKGASSYNLQISNDEFATVFWETTTTQTYAIIEDLPYETLFNIRLQAISPDSKVGNSLYLIFDGGISTESGPTVNIFKALANMTSTSATVAWNNDAEYRATGLELYLNGELLETVTSGISNNQYTFNNLTPETEYTVRLLSDHELYPYIGTVVFTTYPDGIIMADTDLDLRTFIAGYPDGSVFLLPQGRKYSYSGGLIERSFTLIGDVGEEKVLFYIDGTLQPKENNTVDHLRFNNLNIDGTGGEGAGAYKTGMFIADGGQNSTINLVEFQSCDVSHTQWAFIYLKANGQVINDVYIDDCTFYDLGAFWGNEAPILGTETLSGYNNVVMTNSTLMNCPAGVVTSRISASGGIRIENCTFYDAIRAPYALINYAAGYTVAGDIIIKNNLFGANFPPFPDRLTQGAIVNGIALVSSANISGNYATTDYSADENAIPGMGNAGGDSESVFQDPANYDLTIVGNTMKRLRSGDQRWYE